MGIGGLLLALGLSAPLVIAKGKAEVRLGGPAAFVQIVMVDGEVRDDLCAGSAHAVGQFVVDVEIGRGKKFRSNLNELLGKDSLDFVAWEVGGGPIAFSDYNRDGQIDFNLSEAGCGNNGGYYLFTIQPTGQVRLLPVESGAGLGINDDAISTSGIDLVDGGIRTSWYNNAKGAAVYEYYRWSKRLNRFEHTRTVEKPW